MTTKYEYFNTEVIDLDGMSGDHWIAQSFTPDTTHLISSVKLRLRGGSGTGTLTVSIKATDDGLPTGDDLCSGTTNGETLPSAEWEQREITFSTPAILASGTVYAIVVRGSGTSAWNWASDSGVSVARDYYTAGDDGGIWVSGNNWYCQTFTPAVGYSASSVKAYMQKVSTGGTITAGIYATDVDGKPTGTALATGTNSDNDAGTVWREITFGTAYTVTADTKYALVISANGLGFNWRRDGSSPTYTGGSYGASSNAGSSWTLDTAKDFMFEVYGTAAYSDGKASQSFDAGSAWSQIGAGDYDNDFEEWGDPVIIPADIVTIKKLYAIAGDKFYYGTTPDDMAELTLSNITIDCSDQLSAFEAFSKVFIVNGANKGVVDFINSKITTADVAPTDKAIPNKGQVLKVTDGDSGAKDAYVVCDFITASDGAGTLYGYVYGDDDIAANDVLEDQGGTGDADVQITISAIDTDGPFDYLWTPYGNDSSTYGSLPTKAYIGCEYFASCLISGDTTNPHQWYKSEVDNPWKFAVTPGDAMSAVSGQQSDAAKIEDIVRALMPLRDDYCIMACANSVHFLMGNPAAGGQNKKVPGKIGIFGAFAQCLDNYGNYYFYGQGGLCKIPRDLSQITTLSQVRLPDIVKDEAADPTTHRVIMEYDIDRHGIVLSITKLADGTNSNYFYDLNSIDQDGVAAFWPESYHANCGVYSMCFYPANDPDNRGLLLGCKDGYIRTFSDDVYDDDIGSTTQAISNYIGYGPVLIGRTSHHMAEIKELTIITDEDTDAVSYELYVGNTAEAVKDAMAARTGYVDNGTLAAGINFSRPKNTGVWMGLIFYKNTSDNWWSIDTIEAEIEQAGEYLT